ncbi:MAG: FAD-binding protein, partial [Rhodothermales bacterium]|nr:FAD-binding protein [Rhodothermales bacterium]
MMDRILCVAAVQDGRIKRSSLEVLSRFREISRAHGASLDVVVADPEPERFFPTLASHGASRIFAVRHDAFRRHLNEPTLRMLEGVAKQSGAEVVAFSSTEATKDVLGALGARMGGSVLSDVASIDFQNGQWVAVRPVMAAKRLAHTRALTKPVLVSVRSGSYAASEDPAEPQIIDVPFDDDVKLPRPEMIDIVASVSGTVDLSEASVVVAAGRGVKDEAGRELVENLAAVFDAPIGATRAIVESGMYP